MRNFVDEVVKCKPNMIYIELSDDDLELIKRFTADVIEKKIRESHHLIDHGQEFKRFYTGTMGERAIEKLLGVSFIDWSIGHSNTYNIADLKLLGIDVGIKIIS